MCKAYSNTRAWKKKASGAGVCIEGTPLGAGHRMPRKGRNSNAMAHKSDVIHHECCETTRKQGRRYES